MRAFTALSLLLLSAALAPPVASQYRAVEQGFETSPSMLVLPTVSNGLLLARTCPECRQRSLRASSETQYQLGERTVSLATFAGYVKENPNASVTVRYLAESNVLTGIKVHLRPAR